MVSHIVGANIQKINRYVEGLIPDRVLSRVSWRLRANGIWRMGKVCSEVGLDESSQDKSIGLILESMCAAGLIERNYEGKKHWQKWAGYHEAKKPLKRFTTRFQK